MSHPGFTLANGYSSEHIRFLLQRRRREDDQGRVEVRRKSARRAENRKISAARSTARPKPLSPLAMENRYRKEVENLKQALDRNDARAEASEHLRGLTGKIVLTPEPRRDQLRIDLHGDLAGILQITSQKQVRPGNTLDSGPNKIALVAGAGFEPATFGL